MWPHGAQQDGFFYGFPCTDGLTMKTADEFYGGAAADPDAIDRQVPRAASEQMHQAHFGRPRRPHGDLHLYRNTDSGFVIDWHPSMANVLAASPCSGHGFKHSAAIGEAVSATLLGQTTPLDMSPFALGRLTG